MIEDLIKLREEASEKYILKVKVFNEYKSKHFYDKSKDNPLLSKEFMEFSTALHDYLATSENLIKYLTTHI